MDSLHVRGLRQADVDGLAAMFAANRPTFSDREIRVGREVVRDALRSPRRRILTWHWWGSVRENWSVLRVTARCRSRRERMACTGSSCIRRSSTPTSAHECSKPLKPTSPRGVGINC